ncbi:MAG: hypothetical protein LBD50_02205 [Rickettsiales bacterium]|nr:hypothetical protein [Rickettsiales bacterium]
MTYLIPGAGRRIFLRAEKLYDFRKKMTALRAVCPGINFRRLKMFRGGWNIGFIAEGRYVFKIRKRKSSLIPAEIMREKRITEAFAPIVPARIPKLEIIKAGEYVFYKYEFIPGKNLNMIPIRTIRKNVEKLGRQIAEFVFDMHNSDPESIRDLKTGDGDGWNHNDLCNNIIVNPKTMEINGIIDWEYAGFGKLETEFKNISRFSRNMRDSGILEVVRREYENIRG